MDDPAPPRRSDRVAATRGIILSTAERLMAEHGVYAVSNRQIGEAAGQGNTAAVGYHFGTKQDLVREIVRRHSEDVERRRRELVAAADGSPRLAAWVGCIVRPTTDHLEALGSPTWFARFGAQVMTDPALRPIMLEVFASSPSLRRAVEGLRACLPDLSPAVLAERNDMMRQLIVHMTAERERALADGTPTPRSSWGEAATGLVDVVTGIWLAPVTPGPTGQV
ncbi:MAG: TetR family transcriptional regulator [Pseudonocardia sp.]|nr:TetR family transcriptional regulator [Pseudonocardia sp.]